ncbi:dienelactone hydrolase family protein [Candidatus Woesearchaeota archaeon]|nr:dienelactone hydrolase family protein [Candidatus Woesearchaeota archaeon]
MKYSFIILSVLFLIAACTQIEPEVPPDLQGDEHGTEVLVVEPEEAMNAEWVTYGDNFKDYLVKPLGEGRFPAVIMIHEWWGLNQNIKNMAHELAGQGYVVLAVDLFDGKVAETPEEARGYSSKARNNMDRTLWHLKSAVSFLRESDFVSKDNIASMGWCFGGGMSLQLSLNEDLAATVIYYGNLETNESKLSNINWPVLGVFGEEDTGIPVSSVNEFDAALDDLGVENEIYIYEGVGHAFANPSNPGHDPEKTEDAWKKTVAFLDRNLKK